MPNAPISWRWRGGDDVGGGFDHGDGMGVGGVGDGGLAVTGQQPKREGGRRRVEARGCGDRVDRSEGSTFGLGRKSPPENFFDGGGYRQQWPAVGVVADGGRKN
ncbi:hypothetical protein Tco_0342195 [Tanacetum coccineum]